MSDATYSRPHVNGILETSLYIEHPMQSVEFYRRVFGFEPIDTDPEEGITDETRLCAMRAVTAAYFYCSRKTRQQTQMQRVRSTSPSAFHGRNYQHGRRGSRSKGLRSS